MPRITKTFNYDKTPDNNTCSIYHYKDFESNTEQIPYNDSSHNVYLEYNKRFFRDLFNLLEQTNLLENSEIINDSNIGANKYMQSFTVFGCKFQTYLLGNEFLMFKDFMPITNMQSNEEYYNALVSRASYVMNINHYTITVNYGQTYLDVYINKDDAENLCLFTLIKCHSVDNKYDFVYASKNVNGVSYIGSTYYNYSNGTSGSGSYAVDAYLYSYTANCPIQKGDLNNFYHHIYYCDKYKFTVSLHNFIMKGVTTNTTNFKYIQIRESRHAMQCGPDLFKKDNLFEKYDTNNIFNISVNGIKIMRPIACNMNIVFDDLDEVLIGPSNIGILCPGRDYTINNTNYYCPGTEDIVYEIKNKEESYYSGTCNRWFFKL